MEFLDKYTTEAQQAAKPEQEKDKIVISQDAYAVGEMLQKLINISRKWR